MCFPFLSALPEIQRRTESSNQRNNDSEWTKPDSLQFNLSFRRDSHSVAFINLFHTLLLVFKLGKNAWCSSISLMNRNTSLRHTSSVQITKQKTECFASTHHLYLHLALQNGSHQHTVHNRIVCLDEREPSMSK